MWHGKSFTIITHNLSDENFYIQSCTLNGRSHEVSAISHEAIMHGGELVFEMGNKPNFSYGMSVDDSEYAMCDTLNPIWYPGSGIWHSYVTPIPIHETTTLSAYTQKENGEPSFIIESVFQKIPKNRKIKLHTRYAPQYSAGGDIALIDSKKGGENFKTGTWQGYEGVDLDAVVDLGEVQEVSQISAGFLQDVGSWIFFPVEVQFFTSLDGETFTPAGISNHELSQKDFELRTLEQWIDMNPPVQTRFVWVVAKNPGVCPDWHPGAGNSCWIFVDEISVE
ncbi:MAG: hypothetical protein D4R67_08240 [Bacteroidetes bacterium]|nr:MAG: hypothetical protein D4R67_08240 [Bacteroidota bacterium]